MSKYGGVSTEDYRARYYLDRLIYILENAAYGDFYAASEYHIEIRTPRRLYIIFNR